MKQPQPVQLWGALWRSRNRLDGEQTHLLGNYDNGPALFRTRAKAREWIEKHYGYIAKRPDLRAEPHGWLIPIPVRVVVSAVSNDQSLATAGAGLPKPSTGNSPPLPALPGSPTNCP